MVVVPSTLRGTRDFFTVLAMLRRVLGALLLPLGDAPLSISESVAAKFRPSCFLHDSIDARARQRSVRLVFVALRVFEERVVMEIHHAVEFFESSNPI